MNETEQYYAEARATPRQLQALEAYLRLGSYAAAAKELRVSRQDVFALLNYSNSTQEKKERIPNYYKDRGCPDGTHKYCLSCPVPLEQCPYQ